MSELYELLLIVHSFTRWWVLLACAGTVAYALGVGKAHTALAGRVFVLSVDLQVLLGMSLYLELSPLARAARQLWVAGGFRAFWAQPELRSRRDRAAGPRASPRSRTK